jgi:hypothetical protein
MQSIGKIDFALECVHLDGSILQCFLQMNNMTLVGIIEEELENVTPTFFKHL